MKVLAVETSTLTGSVAIVDDTQVIAETTLSVSLQHSERLMPAIEELLRNATIHLSEIDLFAVSQGPGSFTGLRIGVAAVQGLALSQGKPVMGVSSLAALARNGFFFKGLIVPILNAFRNEVYAGFYLSSEKSILESMVGDQVLSPTSLFEKLLQQNEKVLLLGNGVVVCQEILKSLDPEKFCVAPAPFQNPRASHVAFLALQQWERGEIQSAVTPCYLRKAG